MEGCKNIEINKENVKKKLINLGLIKGCHAFILAKKKLNDIKNYYGNDTIFIKPKHSSEYALLAFGILYKTVRNRDKQWSIEDVEGLLKYEGDINDEGKNFYSSGTYFHYGNVGCFGRNKKNDSSTVSTYIWKKGEEDKAASYEEEVTMVLKTAVK